VVTVVYITGSGRSGSTILGLMLAHKFDASFVGQTRDLHAAWTNNTQCTCGEPIRQCLFWGKVLKTNYGKSITDQLHEIQENRKFFRSEYRRIQLENILLDSDFLKSQQEYLLKMQDFYHSCANYSQNNIIIDSSKSPEGALALLLTQDIDVKILNIVRNPIDVVRSFKKRNGEAIPVSKYMQQWETRQAEIQEIKNIFNHKVHTISYDQLCQNPDNIELTRFIAPSVVKSSFSLPTGRSIQTNWEKMHLYLPANEEVLAKREPLIYLRPPARKDNLPSFHCDDTNERLTYLKALYEKIISERP
jgi:hypothetical protein